MYNICIYVIKKTGNVPSHLLAVRCTSMCYGNKLRKKTYVF